MTDQTTDLIQRYAAEIERIIDAGTAADHTWVGLLSAFMQEYAGDPVPAFTDMHAFHLATAQRWLSTAQDSRSFDHLMSAMDQILAHLDAMQAEESLRRGLADIAAGRVVDLGTFAPSAQEVTSAPQTAPQAAMAVLCDEGADSEGGWHSWRCFDRERYPEPCDCTEQVARAALAAAEPHIRAKTLAPIRAALANHPRCDIHPDDDPIKCGWKQAVADIQAVLDRQEQPR